MRVGALECRPVLDKRLSFQTVFKTALIAFHVPLARGLQNLLGQVTGATAVLLLTMRSLCAPVAFPRSSRAVSIRVKAPHDKTCQFAQEFALHRSGKVFEAQGNFHKGAGPADHMGAVV